MNEDDLIVKNTILICYPFILLFGFYMIINGHRTSGGGFHGGAVLATFFIIRYLLVSKKEISINKLEFIEKILFLCILLLPMVFIFNNLVSDTYINKQIYLILMNIIIGIKVCCGLTIIFYRFVLYESR